jgi:hypothetical protein
MHEGTPLDHSDKGKQSLEVLDFIIWDLKKMDCFHYPRRPNPFPRELWQAPNILRSDLVILNLNHVRWFGKCDSITNLEEVDLSKTLRKIKRHTLNAF